MNAGPERLGCHPKAVHCGVSCCRRCRRAHGMSAWSKCRSTARASTTLRRSVLRMACTAARTCCIHSARVGRSVRRMRWASAWASGMLGKRSASIWRRSASCAAVSCGATRVACSRVVEPLRCKVKRGSMNVHAPKSSHAPSRSDVGSKRAPPHRRTAGGRRSSHGASRSTTELGTVLVDPVLPCHCRAAPTTA